MGTTNPNEHDISQTTYSPSRNDRGDYLSVAGGGVTPQKFLSDAYHYQGGFRNGKYLVPFPIEGYYDRRRDFSHYVNFFAAIVDAMVIPVFSRAITRQLKSGDRDVDNEWWDLFVEDCDGAGTALSKLMQRVATYTRIHSMAFIIVDNFPEDIQPEAGVDALTNRIMPYIYIKTAEDVYDYKKDELGRLLSITFYDKIIKERVGHGDKNVQLYRKWTTSDSTLLRKDAKTNALIQHSKPVSHDLGVVPVVVSSDKLPDSVTDLLPDPKLYGVGRVCLGLFNKDSEMRELERKQEFALLTIPGTRAGDKSIGAGNILYYPIDSSGKPEWIAPSADTLTGLLQTRNALREDLYGLAEQHGVVARKEAKSGVALAYEFQAHNSVLNDTANICEEVEALIFDIFARYMVWQNQYELSVKYNREYLPYNTSEQIVQDEFLIDSGVPLAFKVAIWRDHYVRRFPDASQEDIDAMVSEVIADKDMQNEINKRLIARPVDEGDA